MFSNSKSFSKLFIASVLLAGSLPAFAIPITLSSSYVVFDIRGATDTVSGLISVGDEFHTLITYESETVDSEPSPDLGLYVDAITGMSVSFDSGIEYERDSSSSSEIRVSPIGGGLFSVMAGNSGLTTSLPGFSRIIGNFTWDISPLASDALADVPVPPVVVDAAEFEIYMEIGGESVEIAGTTIGFPSITHVVPEPPLLLLLGTGLVGLVVAARKKKQA